MKIKGEPRAFLSNEARQLLNLYESLGERAEIFFARHIYDQSRPSFVKLFVFRKKPRVDPGCPAVGDYLTVYFVRTVYREVVSYRGLT